MVCGQVGWILCSLFPSQMDFQWDPIMQEFMWSGPLLDSFPQSRPSQWKQSSRSLQLSLGPFSSARGSSPIPVTPTWSTRPWELTITRKIKLAPNVNSDYGDDYFAVDCVRVHLIKFFDNCLLRKSIEGSAVPRRILTFTNLICFTKSSKVHTKGRLCGQSMVNESV